MKNVSNETATRYENGTLLVDIRAIRLPEKVFADEIN